MLGGATVVRRLTVLGSVVGFLWLLLVGLPGTASTDELRTLFRGVRPAGMANAFLTLSDDDNALFYNPAGLNDIKSGYITILNPLGELSAGTIDLYNDLRGVDPNNPNRFAETLKVVQILNRNIGEHRHGRAALFPNYVRHNLGFGILAQGTVDAEARRAGQQSGLGQLDVDSRVDLGAVIGGAFGFKERRIQIGATGKFFQRQALNPNPRTFTITDLTNKSFDPFKDLTTKTAFAIDLGTKVNVPVRLSPTVALVGQNLADLDFQEIGKIPSTINAAVAINPDLWILGTTFALEWDDVGNRLGNDTDQAKRLHAGAELRLPKILSLRGGINQGYLTAGVTLNLWLLQLAYATYAEEVGAYAGQRGDRRHLAQLTFGF